MEIVPSILESTVEGFKVSLGKVVGFAERIQVDFNDGSFADTKTVMPGDIADLVLPFVDRIFFEAHLMVQRPYDYIPKLKEMGFRKIIMQFEIEADLREIFEQLIQEDVLVGLAIGPETPISDAEPFAEYLDTITIMDIAPGKQGQRFLPQELQKIRELRDGNFDGEIQADGAIDSETIGEVAETRPDTLVVGSAIVKASDPEETFKRLSETRL
jgi:ribulose-phosphate 3-epimerase